MPYAFMTDSITASSFGAAEPYPKQLLCGKRELVSWVRRASNSLVGCQRLPELWHLVQALQRAVHVAGVSQIPQACSTANIGFLKATPLLAFHAALEEQATCTTKLYVLCCRGICFLNATPFWAFMPHRESIPRALTALLPWDGSLPPPRPLRFLIQNIWWRALRQKRLLNSLLRLVYRNR